MRQKEILIKLKKGQRFNLKKFSKNFIKKLDDEIYNRMFE